MASTAEKDPIRGRSPVSKPLRETTTTTTTTSSSILRHAAPTASSKSRTILSNAQNTSAVVARTSSANSVSSSRSSLRSNSAAGKASTTTAKVPSRAPSESGPIKVTKVSSHTFKISSSTWTPPAPIPKEAPKPAPPPPKEALPSQPTPTDDPLQIAAQAYPWAYMSSTLDACFKSAEESTTKELEDRSKQVEAEESEISDQRERAEAQRAIDVYDELELDVFSKDAPAIIQLFQAHGDSCDKAEAEALKLANRLGPDPNDEEPLKPYQAMLDRLEDLQNTAIELQESIANLTAKAAASTDGPEEKALPAKESDAAEDNAAETDRNVHEDPDSQPADQSEPSARTQIANVFSACLPVLNARVANLSMAQELIDMALENASLSLRMESMGLA